MILLTSHTFSGDNVNHSPILLTIFVDFIWRQYIFLIFQKTILVLDDVDDHTNTQTTISKVSY